MDTGEKNADGRPETPGPLCLLLTQQTAEMLMYFVFLGNMELEDLVLHRIKTIKYNSFFNFANNTAPENGGLRAEGLTSLFPKSVYIFYYYRLPAVRS